MEKLKQKALSRISMTFDKKWDLDIYKKKKTNQ